MIIEKQKARATLLGRRKRAIIILALSFIVLLGACITINYFVRFVPFVDVDGTEYRIIRKAGKFALYDMDGNKLEPEDEYSYFVTQAGTLVDVNVDTGKTQVVAVVDTEYGESNDERNNLLIFPKVGRNELSSLEVHNSKGSFTFLRYDIENDRPDNNSDFIIKNAPFTPYDKELFAELYVNAGYTISRGKIKDPIKDAKGEFSEYGLVPEERVDEEGNVYNYEPAYYIITEISGKKHKIIIGDMLLSGSGYYIQYAEINGDTEQKRDAVYVLETSIGDTLLQSIELFVTPQVVYQMSATDYLDVEDFGILRRNDQTGEYEYVMGFTFVPLSERQGTIRASRPYVFTHKAFDGFEPNVDNINGMLYNFYLTEYEGVKKLNPTNQQLAEYGLGVFETKTDSEGKTTEEFKFSSKYNVSYYYDILDPKTEKYISTIKQVIFISDKNENGNFYAYSVVYEGHPDSDNKAKDEKLLYSYDMIVEIKGYCFDFLTWDSSKWINDNYIDFNIAFVDKITVETKDYNASFDVDNSKSPVDGEKVDSSLLTVHAIDSKGNDFNTFSSLTVLDKGGYIWTITATSITAADSKGEKADINNAYFAHNALGRQVLCVKGYIDCLDGRRVQVTPNEVIVTEKNGTEARYLRYATSLFRQFYQTLLVATIVDTYEMTDAEEAALFADDSKLLMTMTISDTDGGVKVYKFYRLTSRKAYISINGSGGFYVMTDRVEKVVSDVQKFFAGQEIDPTSKN